MSFVTHFKSPEGQDLQIAASELVTVEIPAAGSADLGNWRQNGAEGQYSCQSFTDATAACVVLQSCTDPSVFTDNSLRVVYEEQLQDWVLWIDVLPETACTLTLLFINHDTEDAPMVLQALGVDAVARKQNYAITQAVAQNYKDIVALRGRSPKWKEVKYKPFHKEEREVVIKREDKQYFNVEPNKRAYNNDELFKVSNHTPTLDELMGGEILVMASLWDDLNGGLVEDWSTKTITEDLVHAHEEGKILVLLYNAKGFTAQWVTVCYEDNVQHEGVTYPEAGVYFASTINNGYTQTLTYAGKIDVLDDTSLPVNMGVGVSVTEIESPEEITADSPDGLYIQNGGSSTPSGDTTIHYYDSLGEVPADLPEGAFVAVPAEESAGGGGLPVVELSTPIRVTTDSSGSGGSTVFTEADNALLENSNASFMLKGTIVLVVDGTDAGEIPFETIASYIDFGGTVFYTLYFFMLEGVVTVIINKDGANWTSIGTIKVGE